jgi:hypothetical protein
MRSREDRIVASWNDVRSDPVVIQMFCTPLRQAEARMCCAVSGMECPPSRPVVPRNSRSSSVDLASALRKDGTVEAAVMIDAGARSPT